MTQTDLSEIEPMRVALSFPGVHRQGGVERVAFECARYLAGRGHAVGVYAHEWQRDQTQPSIRYHAVAMTSRPAWAFGPSYFRACTRRLRHARYDVLNTHGAVCPLGGVHWVHSVQAAWLERSAQMRAPFSAARIKQRLNPLHPVLLRLEEKHFRERNYQHLTALTPEARADLHRLYDVPLEDIDIVPNGFAPQEFNPARRESRREEMRAKFNFEPSHVVLLFVANELERKGYATILEALKILNRPNLRVLVAGRPDPAIVRAQADAAGVGAQVIAGGYGDVSAFHAAADLFVLPTQYEAFCLAILEALGSGLPVVTSRVPGAKDAMQPGINGEMIDDPRSGEQLADALKPLLDLDVRQGYASRAPQTVEDYTWPRVLGRYEQILWKYKTPRS